MIKLRVRNFLHSPVTSVRSIGLSLTMPKAQLISDYDNVLTARLLCNSCNDLLKDLEINLAPTSLKISP